MKPSPVRIGISAGDINGIGPEVALKAALRHRWPVNHRIVIIGDAAILGEQCRKLSLSRPPLWNPTESPPGQSVVIWDIKPMLSLKWSPGKITTSASRAAAAWIHAGVHACMTGALDALVTAPICKEGFHRAGLDVPGHTEMLARLTGTRNVAMMLFGGPLRVVLATRHIPLSKVPGALSKPLIQDQIHMTALALKWMRLKRRRIAVCGLNPHAGEGGELGREEIQIIVPAIRAMRRAGYDVHGPLPGDTVFHQAAAGDYDAVIAMYHDQGLAPLKLIAFDSGVNLTLGLPMVRTSPDHGTAFAIAGQNRANPSSMIEAIIQAAKLGTRPNPWKSNA